MISTQLYHLENSDRQIGVLRRTGASIAYGRVRHEGRWKHLLRPTDAADYGNASACAAFLMIPRSNRIRDGRFNFAGEDFQLEELSSDGIARHGVVRQRAWVVAYATETILRLEQGGEL